MVLFVSLCHTNQAVAVTAQQLQVHPRSSAGYMTLYDTFIRGLYDIAHKPHIVHTDNHMDPFGKDHFAAEVLIKNLAQTRLKGKISKTRGASKYGRTSSIEGPDQRTTPKSRH
jgi:hypothetical protein